MSDEALIGVHGAIVRVTALAEIVMYEVYVQRVRIALRPFFYLVISVYANERAIMIQASVMALVLRVARENVMDDLIEAAVSFRDDIRFLPVPRGNLAPTLVQLVGVALLRLGVVVRFAYLEIGGLIS